MNLSKNSNSCYLISFALAIALCMQSAMADDASSSKMDDAERFFKAGVELLKIENLSGAALEFEQAISLHPTMSALFNLANCYKGMHRYLQAMSTFERIREDFGDQLEPPVLVAIQRHEAEIQKVATALTLKVEPEGATIKLDGEVIGRAPLKGCLYISPGNRKIEVEAADHETFRKSLMAYSGKKAKLSVALKSSISYFTISTDTVGAILRVDGKNVGTTPIASAIPLEAGEHRLELSKKGYLSAEQTFLTRPEESVSVELSLAPKTREAVKADPVVEDDKLKLSLFSLVGLGLTAAAGVTSGLMYIVANSHYRDFKEAREDVEKYDPEFGGEAQALLDKQHSSQEKTQLFSNLGLGFGIGTGVLAVATVIFIGVDIKKSKREETLQAVRFGTTPTSLWVRF